MYMSTPPWAPDPRDRRWCGKYRLGCGEEGDFRKPELPRGAQVREGTYTLGRQHVVTHLASAHEINARGVYHSRRNRSQTLF